MEHPEPNTRCNQVWFSNSLFGAIKFKHGKSPLSYYEHKLDKNGVPTSKMLERKVQGQMAMPDGWYITCKAPFIVGVVMWESESIL